jgi:amino acid transporter
MHSVNDPQRVSGNSSGNRASGLTSHPDLEWHEVVQGSKPGDRYVRIGTHHDFKRIRPGYVVPNQNIHEPQSSLGRFLRRGKRFLIGRPISNALESHERLTKLKALAVYSSDALSSVAYATEEIMKVLVLGGFGLLSLTMPISLLIVGLLAIVVISYSQTIKAYPGGGGSYIVASENLGTIPGLTAASALLIDYVLTVAVSVAAGVAALTSLAPDLRPYTIWMAIGAVLLIMLANMRGIRESGSIFALPTYVFIVMMYLLIGMGIYLLATGGLHYTPPATAQEPGSQSVGLFLLMSAFAQGCTAMTGTEAISDGVPAFQKPEWRNARTTLFSMGLVLGSMFLGMSYLASNLGVVPASETVISQVGRTVFGPGPLWVILQIATALILVLAANTAFADFPRLASFLARDHFIPRTFKFRGDRLAFTVGIASLAVLSILLLVLFNGSLDGLIPLYAVGVFTSFTLSQIGMVVRWRKERTPGWQRSAAINGLGALATATVTLVIASTKFVHGAWLVILLIPLMIAIMRAIRSHYNRLDVAREAETPLTLEEIQVCAVVPIADLGIEARQAIAFACAIAKDEHHVIAVHVAGDSTEAEKFQAEWAGLTQKLDANLVVIESPYRSLISPLLAYIDALKETHAQDTITVVLPEFVPSSWWENLLHNQTALRIKGALLFRPGIVVVNVPYHLDRQQVKAEKRGAL